MKKVVLAAAAVVFASACAPKSAQMPMTQQITDWRGTLSAENNSGLRGAASARSGYGQTGVSVTIAGLAAGEQHPWHIHSGTCGSGGPIVGAPTAYPVLQVGSNGEASASASLNVELNSGSSYYVNIHKSPSDLGTIVGCGPITP